MSPPLTDPLLGGHSSNNVKKGVHSHAANAKGNKATDGAVYLFEDAHPHSQCVRVKLVQLVEVAEDDSILRQPIGSPC